MFINSSNQLVVPIYSGSNVFGIGRALYGNMTEFKKERQVLFDWKAVRFAGLSTLTALVALQRKISSLGCKVLVNHPASEDVRRYISRMNYYANIDMQHKEDFIRHNEDDRFLPVEHFLASDSMSDLPNRLSEIVITRTPLTGNLKTSVDYMFGEVIDNVCVHSESCIGGFVGAQFYPSKHKLELCIVDGGCGIAASLKRNPIFFDMPEGDLLVSALKYGVGENVSGPRESPGYGRGKGLAIITNMVKCADGVMRIISGNAGMTVSSLGVALETGVYFPGTVVSIEIPTDAQKEVSAEELFAGMEGSALLDDLLGKYGADNPSDGEESSVLW